MDRRVFLALVIAIAMFSVAINAGYANEKWKEKVGDDLLPAAQKAAGTASDEKVKVIVWTEDKDLEGYGTVNRKFDIVNAVAMDVKTSKLKALAENPDVKRIDIDYPVSVLRQDSVPMIGATSAASAYGLNGTGISIAVIDTGIYNHSEFGGRIIKQKCFCSNNCCPNGLSEDNNATDGHGHGTHVAGIAAGEKGVAPNASIMAVKVLDDSGNGYTSDIVAGMEWAADNGADIISMSLGTRYVYFTSCYDVSTSDATDNATSRGITVVVAAGNDGASGSKTIAAPGCAKTAITVGNVQKTEALSGSSSKGPTDDNRTKPDLTAPGTSINSTGKDGGYYSTGGTSQATPHISGAAALLMQKYQSIHGALPDPTFVKAILITSVNSTTKAGSQRNSTHGSGRTDVMEMIRIMNYTYNGTATNASENVYGFNVTDSSFMASLVWSENSTFHNNLDLVLQSPSGTNCTYAADPNDTVEQIYAGNDSFCGNETGIWRAYVKGASVGGSQAFYLAGNAENADVTKPQYYNDSYTTAVAHNQSFEASINWTDDFGIAGVYFESNFSGSMENYTALNSFTIGSGNNTAGKNVQWRWFANDTSGNTESTSWRNYTVQKAMTNASLFLNGTEGNVTYYANQMMNISASLNVAGKNITIEANFTGVASAIAIGDAVCENITNSSDLNTSTVYNITAYFNGDENYTGSSATYFTGVCPSCPAATEWSGCSGGTQTRTNYQCSFATGFACSAYSESQGCSSGGSSGSGGGTHSAPKTIRLDEKLAGAGGFQANFTTSDRATYSFGGENHTITVIMVGMSTVTLRIASTPYEITIGIGETRRVDLDSDGTEDVAITLLAIRGSNAELEFARLEPPAQTPPPTEEITPPTITPTKENKTATIMTETESQETPILLCITAVILADIAALLMLFKRSGKSKRRGRKV